MKTIHSNPNQKNYSIGTASQYECEKAMKKFLGPGYHRAPKGYGWESADHLRSYRPSKYKQRRGVIQANTDAAFTFSPQCPFLWGQGIYTLVTPTTTGITHIINALLIYY